MDIEIIRQRIGGAWVDGETHDDVLNPFAGGLVARAPRSTERDLDAALTAAYAAKDKMAAMPAYERANLLRRAAALIVERAEDIAMAMTLETGKALPDSRTEALRAVDTLLLYAEEATRIAGEHIPMDASAAGAGKIGMMLRFPVGVVSAITPFNGPVNLTIHKIGPGLGAGNAVVLKPSPKAPLSVFKLIQCFIDAGVPDGALNLLYGDDVGAGMVSDPRVDMITFTGSTKVGKLIRQAAGMKRVTLELGGVGPTIVHADADIAAAAKACGRNAVMMAGQSCISVQNVFVHRSVAEKFQELMIKEVAAVRFGDPLAAGTEVGTLIDEAAACRVEAMVNRAIEAGAKPLYQGEGRRGALLQPTILGDVKFGMEIVSEEIFGPAASVMVYDDLDPIFKAITNSPYGLQAGIYTNSLPTALEAFRRMRTGGVIINGTSRWRSDQMPYGGVKDSGVGREGARFSTWEMTEERLLVFA
jgi:acyl-CoA reductase-like NAD-dependent aldehyde dehydrogenase